MNPSHLSLVVATLALMGAPAAQAAYARFAAGLSLLAENRFDEARQAFHAALGFDPGFALAEDAFLATPEKLSTLSEIEAEARAGR